MTLFHKMETVLPIINIQIKKHKRILLPFPTNPETILKNSMNCWRENRKRKSRWLIRVLIHPFLSLIHWTMRSFVFQHLKGPSLKAQSWRSKKWKKIFQRLWQMSLTISRSNPIRRLISLSISEKKKLNHWFRSKYPLPLHLLPKSQRILYLSISMIREVQTWLKQSRLRKKVFRPSMMMKK